ncbi:MAG TPA: DUF4185 domain-containing protein [Gemmataceae bacterium]|nr:DUF4185 domain-containing protein [Gemmataceae bacterium]
MTSLLLMACVAAEPPVVARAEPLSEWNEKFTRTEGWVGADGAYSVPISPSRTVWLFGDTFIGSVKGGKRTDVTMVNNTVGIQDGTGAGAKLSFPIRRDGDKPQAQFIPVDGRGFFWPQGGTLYDGKLYLFLAQVEHTKAGGAFGFKQVGEWLAVVSNPADDPLEWKMTQKKLPFCEYTDARTLSFGSAVLQADGFAYVYGFDEKAKTMIGKKSLVVARVPLGKLADLDAWRFFRDGQWAEGAEGCDHLAGGLASELSVSYLPRFQKYAAVYTQNGLSDRIVGRFAGAPEGPWSEPVLFYTCPEMKADKKLFSYAGKAHPQLSGENDLVVSYCVNSFEFVRVVNDAALYWPKFVRVTFK